MKKVLCFIVAMCLILVCCSCSGNNKDYSEYGDSAVIELESVTAKAGDTVKVSVYLNNNPGTATLDIELNYDNSVLVPVSAEASGKLKNEGFFVSNLDAEDEYGIMSDDSGEYCHATWFNAANFTGNGEIMTITFQVSEDAAAGEYPITVVDNEDNLTNQDYEFVDTVYLEGVVTVA